MHLLPPSQEKLPEAAGLLDLAEHRFHHQFAQPVAAAKAPASEFPVHGPDPGRGALPSGGGRAMRGTPGGDGGPDAVALENLQVLFGAIAGVGRQLLGLAARVLLDTPEHAGKLRGVRPLGMERVGNDDRVIGIDRDLGVVALEEAVTGLQDPRVGIGEVPLGAILGRALPGGGRRRIIL